MSKYKNWKPEAINCPTLHSQCQMMAFRILSINPRQNPRSRYDLEMFSYVLDDLDTISIFRNWLKRSRSRYDLHVYADFSNDPILSQHSGPEEVGVWDSWGVGCLLGPEAVVAGPLVEAEEDD